ncbi:MAG: type II toxin-antitoxin system HicB family antitoxin [Microcystaceae cyanobacterium]
MVTYIATVHKEPDSDYGVQFYDFPGCITAGVTLEEAKLMAIEALEGHLSVMLCDSDEIPSPSSLETILASPDTEDAIAFIVIDVPDTLKAAQTIFSR